MVNINTVYRILQNSALEREIPVSQTGPVFALFHYLTAERAYDT